jgi:hypothetical protein
VSVSGSSPRDLAGGVFGVAALVFGILPLFWMPFLFAPLAVVCLMVGIILSPRYRGLYQVAAVVIVLCTVVGGAIAVWRSTALY